MGCWNFPSATSGRAVGCSRVGSEQRLGIERMERRDKEQRVRAHPCLLFDSSRVAVARATRVLHRPVWTFAVSRSRHHLHCPLPQPQRAAPCLGFCQELLRNEKKTKTSTRKPSATRKLCWLR